MRRIKSFVLQILILHVALNKYCFDRIVASVSSKSYETPSDRPTNQPADARPGRVIGKLRKH